MRLLYLSSWYPYPADNGSKLRILSQLMGLAQRHEVALLAFHRTPVAAEHMAYLRQFCATVETLPWREYNPRRAGALVGFVSPRPRSLVDTYSPAMQDLIDRERRRHSGYDAIIASELHMAVYGGWGDRPAMLEDLELGAFHDALGQASSPVRRLRASLTWLKMRRYVAGLLPRFRVCTVVSDQERHIVKNITPAFPIEVIPNGLDLASYTGYEISPRPDTLIFCGSLTFQPNYDAVCYFLSQVYPLIRRERPNVRLQITGRHEGVHLPDGLVDASVTLTGHVPDVKPLIAQSWVSLVPIRAGGGTRFKILEAMALGTAVVSTSKGAEGLDVTHDQHLLLADTPQTFADATLRLLAEPGLRSRLVQAGHRLVAERYNWSVITPRFLELVERLAA